MKVSNRVIEQFKVCCPISYLKCDSITDVEYKIKRAVTLGRKFAEYEGRKYIQYYHLQFTVQNGKVIDLTKDYNKYIEVSENVKNAYDRLEGKLLV
ncbi:hypothetical protein G7L40_20775 [Paenibacillus polymyxa]|uniref:Uncharacterized protein n=1 Tax=Paenibacillus polymyxa TaxID=1406 RepID=A0A378Y0U2_PAEPO|nr:hypothetical protein [Paenibacillus polymyxa]MBE7896071.1 hypothetical protein [Paenibacillus polymyxa]MBG9765973.1 hypothetical protein [Paenibacillus polymyxa]MCC3256608.1 hypothetical protein [Paenibacillus polymyxa]QPK54907.1 hypothetical protein G7035_20830 [Paenibacillus polymyxa]QPK59995.1 hypothetical protein G7L40_20775 [Paenibacillus polymyxa]